MIFRPRRSSGGGNAAAITAGRTSVAEMKDTSITTTSTSFPKLIRCEIAGIGLFQQADACILTQAEIDLAVAGIDCDHACSAALEKTIGKSSGRSSDVEADFACDIDLPVRESFLQFETAAADILEIFAEQADVGGGVHGGSSFFDFLSVDQYLSGED